MSCNKDRNFNTDLWYFCSYQSTTHRVSETRCTSSTTSANSVFECSVNEATLVSKRKWWIAEIRQILIMTGKSITAKGRFEGHLVDKCWQQVKENLIFRQSLRATKEPGLFGFTGSCKICKSAQIMYDLKGEKGSRVWSSAKCCNNLIGLELACRKHEERDYCKIQSQRKRGAVTQWEEIKLNTTVLCIKKTKKQRSSGSWRIVCAGVFSRFFPEGERHCMHK